MVLETENSNALACPVDTLVKCGDIVKATNSMKDFWNTYDMQPDFENYSAETFINDAIYSIGLAINNREFHSSNGFDKFKDVLRRHLNT